MLLFMLRYQHLVSLTTVTSISSSTDFIVSEVVLKP